MAKKKSKKPSASTSTATAAPAVNGDTPMADAQQPAQNNGSSSTSSTNSSADPSASSSSSSSFTFQMDLDGLTPSQKAEKSKAQGNEKFKAGQYGLAVDLYTEAINLDAEEPSYYTNRAAAQMALKRYTEALVDCQRAASLQAGSPQPKTLSRLARCQIALGQINEASSTLSEVLSLDPSNATAKADQARIVKINKDIEAIDREHSKKEWSYVLFGLDSLNKEIEVFPLKWKVYKVEALLGKKRVDEASSLASDLLRSHSNDPDVLWIRGQVLFSQGNAAQAVAHCQAALRNDPDHARARTLLKKVRAIESLKESGNDSFKSGKWQEAILKYSECIDLLSQDSGEGENEVMKMTLLSNRATAFQKAGQNENAIKDADSILARDAKHFKALRTRARAHFAAESYEAAIQDFANAFQEAPAGSPEERAMKTEHRQAEVALKRSKTKDYYKILQVERTATEVEIKKAYRKQSLVHHPDKGGDEEKFKEVQEAHSTLSDPQKRRRYDLGEDDNDMGGMGGMGGHGFHSHPFASHGGFGGGSPFGGGFSDGGINLEDLLNGGRRGGSGFSYNFG